MLNDSENNFKMGLTEEQKKMIEKKKQEALQRKQQRNSVLIQSSLQFNRNDNLGENKLAATNQSPTKNMQMAFNSLSPKKQTFTDVGGQCSSTSKDETVDVRLNYNESTSPPNRSEINRLKALNKLKTKQMSSPQKCKGTLFKETILPKEDNQLNVNQTFVVCLVVKTAIWFRLEHDLKYMNVMNNIVKDFKSKNYDTYKRQWSLHIKDYQNIVSLLGKHKSVKIKEEIPSTVVNILQSAHRKQNQNVNKTVKLDQIGKNILEKLMQFQKEGVQFAIQKEGRILIADDMGLGKTVQAIAICDYYIDDWPVLVICPSSVKMSWQQHFLSWVPSLSEDDINIIHTGKDEIYDASVTIVSYDMASKISAELSGRNFQIIVVDESHMLKNSQAARTRNLLPIIQVSKRAILLSGTPALSRPKELFTQISALRRNLFKSYIKFAKRYCDAKEGRYGLEDNGCTNSDELNVVLKSTVMIRRMKYEVLDQLPSKMRQIVVLDPSLVKKNEELQSLEKGFLTSKKEKRRYLLQFYEASARSKTEGVVQFILEKLESTNKKMTIFGHHKVMLDAVEEAVNKKKINSIRISGNTSAKSRQSYVDVFNTEESYKVAILSLTAAGTGINMTASTLVVFAELYWNPGHLIQAEDRIYRIGQKQSVSVIYLVAKETVDDYIWPMVKSKLNVLTTLGVGTKRGLEGASTSQLKEKEEKQQTIEDFFAGLDDLDGLDGLEGLGDGMFEPNPKRAKLT